MAMKIYTKTGDKGSTSLIGGTKVPKSHLRIESYGTVDELNSFIGLLRDQLGEAEKNASILASLNRRMTAAGGHENEDQPTTAGKLQQQPAKTTQAPHTEHQPHETSPTPDSQPDLETIRMDLLEIQDRLFTIGSSLACDPEKEPKLKTPDLKEEDITALEKSIDQMDSVLPPMKSFVLPGGHVAVSTTHIVRCVCRRAERSCVRIQEEGLFVEPMVIRYLNRLSDYFFELARYVAQVLGAEELPWHPRT
jgi:cob(I)alamin adenosyltransferase